MFVLQRSNKDIQQILEAYETICLSGADCMDNLHTLNADPSCINAINNDLSDVYCTGNCRDLIDDAFETCPMVSNAIVIYNNSEWLASFVCSHNIAKCEMIAR